MAVFVHKGCLSQRRQAHQKRRTVLLMFERSHRPSLASLANKLPWASVGSVGSAFAIFSFCRPFVKPGGMAYSTTHQAQRISITKELQDGRHHLVVHYWEEHCFLATNMAQEPNHEPSRLDEMSRRGRFGFLKCLLPRSVRRIRYIIASLHQTLFL